MNNKIFSLLSTLSFNSKQMPEALRLSENGVYESYYAPFEFINRTAKVVICGITPGLQQANIALATAQKELAKGRAPDEVLKTAKHAASFAGPMRRNLASMLDHICLQEWLGIDSTAELFESRQDLIHFTSALRNPVFANGANFSGGPAMVNNPYLWEMAKSGLTEEIRQLPGDAVYIPMGKGVDAVFERLISEGVVGGDRVLFGLPHASGANAERIAYFCGRKERDKLSLKTNPDSIDERRQSLQERVCQLVSSSRDLAVSSM